MRYVEEAHFDQGHHALNFPVSPQADTTLFILLEQCNVCCHRWQHSLAYLIACLCGCSFTLYAGSSSLCTGEIPCEVLGPQQEERGYK
jgi:hypothetical protein